MVGQPCCGGLLGDAPTLMKTVTPVSALNDQIGRGGNCSFGLSVATGLSGVNRRLLVSPQEGSHNTGHPYSKEILEQQKPPHGLQQEADLKHPLWRAC